MQTVLENSELKLTIRPDLGGRIDQLLDQKTGREWLWHPPSYDESQPRSLPVGAPFDEHWSGGWDEMFPNDGKGLFQNRHLVDHGELWSQAWNVLETTPSSIKMTRFCETVPIGVEKTIRLDGPQARIEFQFHNKSDETIPFLFKHHAAIAIEAEDEILLPDCLIEPVMLGFSTLIGRAQKTRFPKAFAANGQEVDLRKVLPRSSRSQEYFYSSDLAKGECGVRHQRSGTALLMTFDQADFPYVWVLQSYGGWRDHYVLVMQPCTTIPYDLDVACQNETAAQLQPNERQSRVLTICLQR